MSRKITTWRRNFRRWSTQVASVMAVLGGIEAVAQAAVAFQTTLPLWKPIMPGWAFAATSSVLGIAIVILRNIAQDGVD